MPSKDSTKFILLTGAQGYLGQNIASALKENGYDIIGFSHREQQLSHCRQIIQLDYLDTQFTHKLNQIKMPPLSAIIHCAAISKDATLINSSLENFNHTWQVNLKAVMQINEHCKQILEKPSHIIHFCSRVGILGNYGQTPYATTKDALIQYSKALSAQWGNMQCKVNAIIPGVHDSPILGPHREAIIEESKKQSVLQRTTDLSDVINCVLFLLKSKTISGQVFATESRLIT